jgi:hypothetical protein
MTLKKKKQCSQTLLESEHVGCIVAHIPLVEDDTPSINIMSSSPSHRMTSSEVVSELLVEINQTNLVTGTLLERVKRVLSNQLPVATRNELPPSQTCSGIKVHHTPLPMCQLDSTSGSVCCWWCTCPFDGNPVHLPHRIVDDVFQVTGYFCSFNCCLAYNVAKKERASQQRETLLHVMYHKLLGPFPSTSIIPAPPREVLEKFGGWMTIEEFRSKSTQIREELRLLLPPLQSVYYTIEAQQHPQMSSYPRHSKSFVPLNVDQVKRAKESLKLKRSAPRKSNYVSLEETLGLVKRSQTVAN